MSAQQSDHIYNHGLAQIMTKNTAAQIPAKIQPEKTQSVFRVATQLSSSTKVGVQVSNPAVSLPQMSFSEILEYAKWILIAVAIIVFAAYNIVQVVSGEFRFDGRKLSWTGYAIMLIGHELLIFVGCFVINSTFAGEWIKVWNANK